MTMQSDTSPTQGLVHVTSVHDFAQTLQRLDKVIADRGIQVFCRIDHSGEAAKNGLELRPTVVTIFGNPKAGTPLMVEAPTAALDLPLKILIWQDESGTTHLICDSADYLRLRHGLTGDLRPLHAVEDIIALVGGSKDLSS